jgi:hypothetical protein
VKERSESELLKLEKSIEETFVDSVRALSEPEIKNRLVNIAKELEDVQNEQKENAQLNELKEQLKVLNSGYSELKKEKKKRIKYLLLLLESRGKL